MKKLGWENCRNPYEKDGVVALEDWEKYKEEYEKRLAVVLSKAKKLFTRPEQFTMKQKQPRTFIIYDTAYNKAKDGKEVFWAINYVPVGRCVAIDAEAALAIAKKQGHKLPVIGEGDVA